MQEQKIETEYATLWTAHSTPSAPAANNPTILCVHGQSSSSRIFEPLLSLPELKDHYELIVFDFPGHGRSSNAPDPARSYYEYGYAGATLEVLRHYDVKNVIILGWSLGGHVPLELVSRITSLKEPTDLRISGMMLMGTSPSPRGEILGFKQPDVDISALFNPDATDEEVVKCADFYTKARPPPQWIVDDLLRTDRLTGHTNVASHLAGKDSDQVKVVDDFTGGWIALVNGSEDSMMDLDYVANVCKDAPCLWRGKSLTIEGAQHSPFFDDPKGFLQLFLSFLDDCKKKSD